MGKFSVRGDGLTTVTTAEPAVSALVAHATHATYGGAGAHVLVAQTTAASDVDFWLFKVSAAGFTASVGRLSVWSAGVRAGRRGSAPAGAYELLGWVTALGAVWCVSARMVRARVCVVGDARPLM